MKSVAAMNAANLPLKSNFLTRRQDGKSTRRERLATAAPIAALKRFRLAVLSSCRLVTICVKIFTPASLKQQSNKDKGGARALISIKNFLIKNPLINNPSLCCLVALREKISQSHCVKILTPASLKQQCNKDEGVARALISIKNFLIKNPLINNPRLCCFVALREI